MHDPRNRSIRTDSGPGIVFSIPEQVRNQSVCYQKAVGKFQNQLCNCWNTKFNLWFRIKNLLILSGAYLRICKHSHVCPTHTILLQTLISILFKFIRMFPPSRIRSSNHYLNENRVQKTEYQEQRIENKNMRTLFATIPEQR